MYEAVVLVIQEGFCLNACERYYLISALTYQTIQNGNTNMRWFDKNLKAWPKESVHILVELPRCVELKWSHGQLTKYGWLSGIIQGLHRLGFSRILIGICWPLWIFCKTTNFAPSPSKAKRSANCRSEGLLLRGFMYFILIWIQPTKSDLKNKKFVLEIRRGAAVCWAAFHQATLFNRFIISRFFGLLAACQVSPS